MPTVLRVGRFRFFFFSNEGQEPAHVHVKAGEDEAKFWLNPVQLVANYGFNGRGIETDSANNRGASARTLGGLE